MNRELDWGFRSWPAWLLTLSVAGYPMMGLLASMTDWPNRWLSLPFRLGVALLALVLIVKSWRSCRLAAWRWLLLGGLAWYGLRLGLNALTPYPGAMHELLFFAVAVLLPLIALLMADVDEIERHLPMQLVFVAGIIVAWAVAGEYGGWFGANSYTFTGRLSTYTVNPITLGHVAAALLMALVALQRAGGWRGWYWALVVLGLVGLSYASSRGPFLALIGALVMTMLIAVWPGKATVSRQLLAPWKMGAGIVLAAGILLWSPLPMDHLIAQSDQVRMEWEAAGGRAVKDPEKQKALWARSTARRLERLDALRQERMGLADRSSQLRLQALSASWRAFLQYPLLGVSNWEANNGEYPHNQTLESFQNLGVGGGAVMVLLLLVSGYRALQRIRAGGYLLALLYFQALLAAQVSGSLYANAQLWMTMLLLLGATGRVRPTPVGSIS